MGILHAMELSGERPLFEMILHSIMPEERTGRYYYRMKKGYDNHWNTHPGRHSVTYTDLCARRILLEVNYVSDGQSINGVPVSRFDIW